MLRVLLRRDKVSGVAHDEDYVLEAFRDGFFLFLCIAIQSASASGSQPGWSVGYLLVDLVGRVASRMFVGGWSEVEGSGGEERVVGDIGLG